LIVRHSHGGGAERDQNHQQSLLLFTPSVLDLKTLMDSVVDPPEVSGLPHIVRRLFRDYLAVELVLLKVSSVLLG
jgi:hypothetical protein